MSATEEHLKTRAADRFDLYCGTSTGAIIALALAAGLRAREIVAVYEKLGAQVFVPPPWRERRFPKLRTARQVLGALHDNKELRKALTGVFGELTLGDLRRRGKKALVTPSI